MDIQRPESVRNPKDAQSVSGRLRSDITRQNRENIEEVAESVRVDRSDRVDVSSTAEQLGQSREAEAAARQERLEALRAAVEAGKLNTPERVERAAQLLLTDPAEGRPSFGE